MSDVTTPVILSACRTPIGKYLGAGYTVLASYGHVRDLPEKLGKNELGVDVDHDFRPDYEIVPERRKPWRRSSKISAAFLCGSVP